MEAASVATHGLRRAARRCLHLLSPRQTGRGIWTSSMGCEMDAPCRDDGSLPHGEVVWPANQPLNHPPAGGRMRARDRQQATQQLCIPPLREGVSAERGPHMGGSLPLATQFHGEGGRRGRMDATTGTPWALTPGDQTRPRQLEYEVTKAWPATA